MCCGKKETKGSKGREEQDGVGSLLGTRGHGDIGPGLLPGAMSGSVMLLQL